MSNLFILYSPSNEKFELSRANYADLLQNGEGWTQEPKADLPVTDAASSDETPAETPAAPETPAPAADETPADDTPADETPADDDSADNADEDASEDETPAADEAPKARLTAEDFADLPEKTDVFAYIEQTFPGNKIDGRANRDKLIAFAIELAGKTAE